VSSVLFAAAVFVAAVVLTYFSCVRPMRRGRCRGATTHTGHGSSSQARGEELARLHAEIAQLREQTPR